MGGLLDEIIHTTRMIDDQLIGPRTVEATSSQFLVTSPFSLA